MDNQEINNKTIEENPLDQIGDILKLIGLNNAEITEYQEALFRQLFISITDDLNKLTALKDKELFPAELKSIEDFFEYYGKYIDRNLIKKIVDENIQKIYSKYLSPALDELK